MKRWMSLLLAAVLALGLAAAAIAEAPAAETPAPAEAGAAGTLEEALALKLSGGKTLKELLLDVGALEDFTGADFPGRVRLLRALALLGRLSAKDAAAVVRALPDGPRTAPRTEGRRPAQGRFGRGMPRGQGGWRGGMRFMPRRGFCPGCRRNLPGSQIPKDGN